MDEQDAEITQWVEDADGTILKLALSDGAIYEMAPDAPEAQGLALGDSIGASQRAALEVAAERKRLARDVFRLLDRRAYPRARLHAKLLDRGYSAVAIDGVLREFEAQGLVDDPAFCRSFCRDQLQRRPVGRRWLRHRLRQQGVADDDILAVLDEILDPERERSLARQALESKGSPSTRNEIARAMRFLQSRGFSEALARDTVFDTAPKERSSAESDFEAQG